MDTNALKAALLIQAQGSIAGAARALGVDASSVSRILAGVEAELGTRLFQRTTRKLSVTDEGRAFLARLKPLIEELEAAQEEARGGRENPSGTLRMTASVAFADQMILPLLPDFQSMYPEITIDLQSSDVNIDLIENAIDLAIRLSPSPKGDLISTRLKPTRYHLVASQSYLTASPNISSPEDLKQENCLRYALPDLGDVWTFRKSDQPAIEVPIFGNLQISNALAMRSAARLGLGVAMLADWLVDEDLQDGRLIRLCPEYECTATVFDTAAWALYPNRSYLPRKVRVMIDFLRAQMKT